MLRAKYNKANMTVLSKVLLIIILDVLATSVAFFLGLWFRFDFV